MLKIQSHNKCGLPSRWWLQVFILPGDAGSGGFFFSFSFFLIMSEPHQPTPRFPRATQRWVSVLETERRGRTDRANTLDWRAPPSPVGKMPSITSEPAHDEGLHMGLGERGGVKIWVAHCRDQGVLAVRQRARGRAESWPRLLSSSLIFLYHPHTGAPGVL